MTASQPKLDTKEQRHEYLRDVFHATLLPYLETLTKDQIKIEETDREPEAHEIEHLAKTRADMKYLAGLTGNRQKFAMGQVDLGKRVLMDLEGVESSSVDLCDVMDAFSDALGEITGYHVTYGSCFAGFKGNSFTLSVLMNQDRLQESMARQVAYKM